MVAAERGPRDPSRSLAGIPGQAKNRLSPKDGKNKGTFRFSSKAVAGVVDPDTIACGTAVVNGRPVGPSPQNCWLHANLLRAGVLLLECISNLERLPKECLFVALPLPIRGGSGSPVRAVAFVPREEVSESRSGAVSPDA